MNIDKIIKDDCTLYTLRRVEYSVTIRAKFKSILLGKKCREELLAKRYPCFNVEAL